MRLLTLFLLLLLTAKSFSQVFSKQRTDGIVFYYTCKAKDSCSKAIIINKKDTLYTKNYNGKNLNKTSIKGKSTLLSEFDKLLSFDLIDRLNKCCIQNKCPDTNCYIYLKRKKDKKIEYIYIDMKFIENGICGQKELNRLIEIFNILTAD